jgi:phage protein U
VRPIFRNIFSGLILFGAALGVAAQSASPTPSEKKPDPKKQEKPKKPEASPARDPNKPMTAESVAESAILIYGGLGGRPTLDQIRKTAIERGKMSLVNAQGQTEQVSYQKWTIRGDSLAKEKIRVDEEYPSIRYALVRADDKTYGVYNQAVFSPRDDAAKEFENRIFHGLEALLRYKENGSTLEMAGHEKILGVDYYFIDVTDKQGRKTRFYVSSKTYRVMMIDYQEDGVKFRRKFYDYNYAQGTLVPYHTTLTANDKLVEETQIMTVTFGQKVDDELFKSGT